MRSESEHESTRGESGHFFAFYYYFLQCLQKDPQNLFIQNLGLGFYYSCTLDFSRVALDPPAAPPKRGEIIQKCFTNNFLEKNIPKTAYKILDLGGK